MLVTGTTAENIDYFDVMERWLPLVLVFVLGLSFVLLTVAFRSIVDRRGRRSCSTCSRSARRTACSCSSSRRGSARGCFGFQQVDVVEAWVPLFLFAVLFGLSMDYQVFLLSRIRERFTHTGDTTDAIAFGISSTARIITGAALIIVAVFAGFAAGDLVMFQQMGFGIAIALLIDATLVRSVLVPAAMQLLGELELVPAELARVAPAPRRRGPPDGGRRGRSPGSGRGEAGRLRRGACRPTAPLRRRP